MDICLTPALDDIAAKIDSEVRGYIEDNSGRYFRNPPKEDWYNPIKKESSKGGYYGDLEDQVDYQGGQVLV